MRRLPNIRAGAMRKRFTFKAPPTTRDSAGGGPDLASPSLDGWMDICTVWGSIAPYLGRELAAADKPTAEVMLVIEIRYRGDINSTLRAVQADTLQVYDIRGVFDVDGRKRKLSLLCRERD